ncbi:MAG TPA: cytochrome b/b6 domain-containing protein [Phenylobacterium sp.]|nr:cytochrome b/b6 domain-containing protein [Phenylobacterium sp.]
MYVTPERRRGESLEIYRHPWAVRITHALNALCLLVLLASGLQILNAHPAFYWGEASRFDRPLAAIDAVPGPDGTPRGRLRVLGASFDTTGVLGASRSADGELQAQAIPAWVTWPSYPDLGAGRAWHFAFAWLFVINSAAYLIHGLASGRLRAELVPDRADLAHLGRSVIEHARLRLPAGEAARRYNVLQKLAYLGVIALALPVMLMTGLAMSPAMHAWTPWLGDVFGGRQSARTLHLLTALALVAFVAVHLLMVLAAGPLNELRAIVTGWYVLKSRKGAG